MVEVVDSVAVEMKGILASRVGAALRLRDPEKISRRVQHELEALVRGGGLALPASFFRPGPDSYARRLLHRDPQLRFTVLVMAWGPGQGTPLHDHAGLWGAECVLAGAMEAESFELLEERADGVCRFASRGVSRDEVGVAGGIAPPREHHRMRNALDEATSVTLHVYGGELDRCSVFLPVGPDLFRREMRRLTYSR